jgi:hypothetical protein
MALQNREWGRSRVALSSLVGCGCALAAVADGAFADPRERPDLDVRSLQAPSSVNAGAAFDIVHRVKNIGDARAKRSQLRFVLSTNRRADERDAVLGRRAVPKLRPRRASRGSTTLTAPNGEGDFFLIACSDARKKLREERERNNCQTTPLDVLAAGPEPLTWLLRNSNSSGAPDLSFEFGVAGDVPVVGDWDGDGDDTVGVYSPLTQTWRLHNSNGAGSPDVTLVFGTTTAHPVAGDWDGDGDDTIGFYEPANGGWALKYELTAGPFDVTFNFTNGPGTVALAGDWDGDGDDNPGFKYDQTRGLRLSNTSGMVDLQFFFGTAAAKPITGDWDASGTDTHGFVQASAPTHNLRNSNSQGPPDIAFSYALPTDAPVAGDWDGDGDDTIGAVR